MSVTFYGRSGAGSRACYLGLDYAHPAFLNFNNGNARSVLEALGLDAGEHLSNECTMSRAKRALLECKMWRQSLASAHTREASNVKRGRGPRVITAGLDEQGIRDRIGRFAEFIETMDRMGAEVIYWS